MTDRDDRLLRLNAALDGELDPMASLEFERELRDDPAFAAEYRRLTTLRDAVRRHAPREAAPQALADRIAALTASAPLAPPTQAPTAPTATVVPFRRRVWLDRRALAMAASFAVLGFALGAGLTSLRTASPSGDVAQHLVSDFARAEIAGQPFDVASSDRHTVKPWLADRTTVSASIVDLAPEGFPLVGGRVAVIDRIPTPTLVYRHNEHLVAVTELPLDAKGAARDRRNRNDRRLPRRRAGPTRTSPMSPFPTWTRRRSANSSKCSGVRVAPPLSRRAREPLVAADRTRSETPLHGRRPAAPPWTRPPFGEFYEQQNLLKNPGINLRQSRSPKQDDRNANDDRRRWRACRSKDVLHTSAVYSIGD